MGVKSICYFPPSSAGAKLVLKAAKEQSVFIYLFVYFFLSGYAVRK